MTNQDNKTGIFYGVISMHKVTQAWADSSEIYIPEDLEDGEDFEADFHDYYVKNDEYNIITCLDSDLMILKSPYYTFCNECSPCVPNAGNLDSPNDEYGRKTYCLDKSWFDDGITPYKVYSVETNQEVI